MKNNFLKKVFTISSFLLLGTLTACNTLPQNNDSQYHEVHKRSYDHRDMKLSKQLNNNPINNDINTKDKVIEFNADDNSIYLGYDICILDIEDYSLQDYFSLQYSFYIFGYYDFTDDTLYGFQIGYYLNVSSGYGDTTQTGFVPIANDDIDLGEVLNQDYGFDITLAMYTSQYINEQSFEINVDITTDNGVDVYYYNLNNEFEVELGQFGDTNYYFAFNSSIIDDDIYALNSYFDVGYDNGFYNGNNNGFSNGYESGFEDGYEDGYEQSITDNAKDTGIFKYGNITLGLYDIDEEEFDTDYSYEGDINTGIVQPIEGGFNMNEMIYDFEESYIENNLASDYSVGYMVDFGELGVDINDVQYLFPLQGQGANYIPRLDYGVQYKFTFEIGVVSFSGADEGPMSSFNVLEYFSGLGRLNNILALGNNYDYVPYGITQNLSYSFGYDSGYESGRSDGFDSGYDVGYLNGSNATASQKYTEGYNKGYLDGVNSIEVNGITFESLAHAIITAPSTMIKNAFDFDILGVNVGGLVNTALVIALVVFAIGLFKKG